MEIRLVSSPSDPAIAAFGALQRRVYFEPEMLIPGEIMGQLLAHSDPQRKNLLLVAEDVGPSAAGGDRTGTTSVVGGALFHAMTASGCGFSSFMGVDSAARGRGIARRLHARRFEALDAALGTPAAAVFIDVVAPERLPPERIEAERRFGSDPFTRRRIFQALGFRKVELAYEQPVGGPGGGPVTTLDLLVCPREPADRIATRLVLETMRAYWTPWLGSRRADLEVERLRTLAAGDWVSLSSASSV